jgi:hypothetical protein
MIDKRVAALAGAAGAAVALAGPAAAGAAEVAPGAACVGGLATGGLLPITGSGFRPGATVAVTADGRPVASVAADSAGNFSAQVRPPALSSSKRNRQRFRLSASDGLITAGPKPVLVTRVRVTVPSRARPTHTVRYRAFGFLPGRRIYLFVRRHGRTLGRFTLGRASGPCGDAGRRLRYMPLRHYAPGTYEYWFSHSRHYSKGTRIYGFRIAIIRAFH